MNLNRNVMPTLHDLLILIMLCFFLNDMVDVPQHRTTESVYVKALILRDHVLFGCCVMLGGSKTYPGASAAIAMYKKTEESQAQIQAVVNLKHLIGTVGNKMRCQT